MILRIELKPDGFPLKLGELTCGLFLYKDTLGFKDEYDGAYVVASGEAFWAGTTLLSARDNLVVQPLTQDIEYLDSKGEPK